YPFRDQKVVEFEKMLSIDDLYENLLYGANSKKIPLKFKRFFNVDKLMVDYVVDVDSDIKNIRNIFKTFFMILRFYKELEFEMESLKIDKFPDNFFNKFEILVNDLNGSLKRSSSQLRSRDVKYKLNTIINDFPKNFRAGKIDKEFLDYLVKVDFFFKIYKYMGYKSGDLD